MARTLEHERKRCDDQAAPQYAAIGAATVNDVAVRKPVDLLHDIFGQDLDLAITSEGEDRFNSKCQQRVADTVTKCFDARLKQFNQCTRKGLNTRSIGASAKFCNDCVDNCCIGCFGPIEGCCIGQDPKGRIAKACSQKLVTVIEGRCAGSDLDLSDVISGCGTDDPGDVAACLDSFVMCRVCQAINVAAGLIGDCDLLDDGQANGSCLREP